MDGSNNTASSEGKNKKKGIKRRDVLKSLATVPVLGALAYGVYKKKKYDHFLSSNIANDLGMSEFEPVAERQISKGKEIRIGIIGYGIRGKLLAKGLGFAHPTMIDEWMQGAINIRSDNRYKVFIEQEDLNVRITGVCDILLNYDSDRRIPIFGFGAKLQFPNLKGTIVSHCFPANGNPEDPFVVGLDAILKVYESCRSNVIFSGPTLFAPLISEAMKEAYKSKNNGSQEYLILLILTDGEIHDME